VKQKARIKKSLFRVKWGLGLASKRGFGTLPDKRKPTRRSAEVLTANDTVLSNMVPLAYACKKISPYLLLRLKIRFWRDFGKNISEKKFTNTACTNAPSVV